MDNQSFRYFLILWIGELIATVGSGLTAFALAVYVFQLTQSASSVALMMLLAFLPTILLAPLAGVLADRFDRRLLMIIGDGCSAFGPMIILLASIMGELAMWHIYLGVVISAAFSALLEPAYKATITDLLPEHLYSKASGLVQLAGASRYLLAPVIAGLLLAWTNIQTILLIDISTIVVTLITISVVRKKIAGKQNTQLHDNRNFRSDFREGWQSITQNKGVLMLTLSMSVVTFCVGFFQTLFSPMILSFTNEKILGTLLSVSATGMLIGSLFLGLFAMNRGFVFKLSLALAILGIFISLTGITTNIYIIGLSAFLFFSTLPFVNTSAEVLLRKNIDQDKQGRAWGLIGTISQLGYVFAYSISGLLADYIFNPAFLENGWLAKSAIGALIGVGAGRGIGFMLFISGALMVLFSFTIYKVKTIHSLELS